MDTSRTNLELTLTESNCCFIPNLSDFDISETDIRDPNYESLGLLNGSNFLYPDDINPGIHSLHSRPDADCIKMFVGQIPQDFNEFDLLQMFEKFGKVYDLRVLRDRITGKSKGCCFITFFTRIAAINAQNAVHNIKVLPGMHHPVQMKPADSENRNDRKLFVGMLPRKFTESDVRSLFSPFGSIEECTVLREITGQSKGCAFVTYLARQSAQNAVKCMHHCHVFEGCSSSLVVKFADTQKDKETRRMNLFNKEQCNQNLVSLILQQIPADILSSLIASNNLFHQLQTSGYVNMNPQSPIVNHQTTPHASGWGTPPSRSGYVTTDSLINHLTAQSVSSMTVNEAIAFNNLLSQLSGAVNLELLHQGYPEYIYPPAPSPLEHMRPGAKSLIGTRQIEGPDGANLFIYHLPHEFTDQRLADLFSPYGTVISSKVFIDKVTRLSKCFGFVSYDNIHSARAAIHNLNGYHILGKKLKVELKKKKSQTR